MDEKQDSPFLSQKRSHFRHRLGLETAPLAYATDACCICLFLFLNQQNFNGFNGSPVLASLMHAKFEQLRSQNMTNEKDWKERKNEKKRNKRNGRRRKPISQTCGAGNYASFSAFNSVKRWLTSIDLSNAERMKE